MEQIEYSEKKHGDSYKLKLQYECDMCPIVFNKHVSLTVHKRIVHGNHSKKSIQCKKPTEIESIGHVNPETNCSPKTQLELNRSRVISIDLNSHWTPILCLMLLSNFVALVCSLDKNVLRELVKIIEDSHIC